jgi:hypothetical protein
MVFREIISAKNGVLNYFKGINSLVLTFLCNYFTLYSISILSIVVGFSKNLWIGKIGDQVFRLSQEI